MSDDNRKENAFIVHIGAHRTGTTSFQTLLGKYRENLADRNVQALTPGILRKKARIVKTTTPKRSSSNQLATAEHRWKLVESLLKDGQRVVMSEENILGSMEPCLRKAQLYPHLRRRLKNLAPLLQNANELILVVRKAQDWWNSLIAVSAKQGAIPTTEQVQKISICSRGWHHVVAEICEFYPEIPLRLIPYSPVSHDNLSELSDASGLSEILNIAGENITTNKAPKLVSLEGHPDFGRLKKAKFDHQGFNFFTPAETKAFQKNDDAFLEFLKASNLPNLKFDITAFGSW